MSQAASRVGLVLVSHSAALAEAVERLARQMTGEAVAIACAAGVGEQNAELGTSAVAIAEAIERVAGPAGAIVLMDLGSAILSAETALDLVDPALAARTRLTAAPLVEGAVSAAVRAAAGGTLSEVADEARRALSAKAAQLGEGEARERAAPAQPEGVSTADVVIADPHGLHARPAARVVLRAGDFDASITIENVTRGKGPASAASLTALASLGARRGDVLRVSASGREAAEAIAALSVLMGEGGESTEEAAPPMLGHALPVAPGVAFGPMLRLVRAPLAIPKDKVDDPEVEAERLRQSLERAARELRASRGDQGIFAAHLSLLRDPELIDRALSLIQEECHNAALAWQEAIEAAAAVYRELDDPYLRARETDLRDAGAAVTRALLGSAAARLPDGPPAVIVADELTPSEALALDAKRALGVIDRRGGPTSHAAILLRAAGIPAVAGAATLVPEEGGELAGLDGVTGEVWVDPDAATVAEIERRRSLFSAERRTSGSGRGRVVLACGREVELWANVAGLSGARAAREAGAAGIGLLRTELLFLERREAPSEDEQATLLAEIFAAFGERPIVVRTLDAGGDKALPYLALEAEANPALGVRGVRLSLARPALLEAELRAILVAGRGYDVRIMLPMVSTTAEVTAVRAALSAAHRSLEEANRPHLWPVAMGIMIEVPAAALLSDKLAPKVDFFSIGTNDLTQYSLAAERGHPRLGPLSDAAHPAVLRLVRSVAEAGRASERPVSVCGEAAADPAVAALLVGLGIQRLSMAPSAFGEVEAALRKASFASLAQAVAEALDAEDAGAARAGVRRLQVSARNRT